MKSIKAEVEGFYWENKSEQMSMDGQIDDGEANPSDPQEFVKRHHAPEGINTSITLHADLSTFELRDNKNNLSYAARI